MKNSTPRRLARLLAQRLRHFQPKGPESEEINYDGVIARVAENALRLEAQLERNRARARERYANLVDEPAGRRATVLENGQPAMLLTLAYDLMHRSYAHRFGDLRRSLQLASLAVEVAKAIARTDYLSPVSLDDLLGEAFDYLGNALRINADIPGSVAAFEQAERHLDSGTRDRELRANHLSFLSSLRYTQGSVPEAAELLEREIPLRKLLGDQERLGGALVNRALMLCWMNGPTPEACASVRRGIEVCEDDRVMFLGLLHLAEAFARENDGVQAWKLLCTCQLIAGLADLEPSFLHRQRWIEGITHRALGDSNQAFEALSSARRDFTKADLPVLAASVGLDLLVVLATQGRLEECRTLAQSVYEELLAIQLEKPALSAFLILHRAAQEESLSEKLAARVVNFIVRFQHNRKAKFEPPEDG